VSLIGSRSDYQSSGLDTSDLLESPTDQLRQWLDEAIATGVEEPTAMCLATASTEGVPSSRMVLMRGLDERGLVFYTHYASPKGRDLEANPHASVTFWWPTLHRQVRVTGRVEHTSEEESDAYFASRPRANQLGSAASPQSQPVACRDELEKRIDEVEDKFPSDVPRPNTWGGYRILPTTFEFWQGRPARVHDRFRYTRTEQGWRIDRLAP